MVTSGAAGLGRIPFRLRVGVSGHRALDNEDALRERVRDVLERIRERVSRSADVSVELTVVSALAEGADRLVAEEVLDVIPRATLEAPLPLPVDDYVRDFKTEDSRRQFDRLRRRASLVIEGPPAKTRDEAYERVGHFVVDGCDVLVALWDGDAPHGRGGTAHIVERARQHGTPLYWINTRRDYEITEEHTERIAAPLIAEAHRYNAAAIDGFDHVLAGEMRRMLPKNRAEREDLRLDEHAEWILPFFVRADQLALRQQRRYFLGTWALVLAAALAVASVAALAAFPTAFSGSEVVPVVVEAVLLLVVIGVYVGGTRLEVHTRWIWYRFLAERFRSAFFLALAGLAQRTEGGFDVADPGDEAQDWARRAFREVWSLRPTDRLPERATPELRQFLGQAWLGSHDRAGESGQIGYHLSRSRRFARLHHRFSRTIQLLLGLTLAAALTHIAVGEGPDHALTWSHVSLFCSLSLPALGAAIAGIAADREYHRHAARYARMARDLARIRSQLEGAKHAVDLRTLTDHAEQTMLEENRDWFGVLRFHGFEPHV
jgi:hypothetical protein